MPWKPPSALPGISPTGGEITSGMSFPPHERHATQQQSQLEPRAECGACCLGKPARPANLPGGDARQGRGGLPRHAVSKKNAASKNFHPRLLTPCLQSPRFRRRSVSRDVRGQAGAGALAGSVTCGKGQGGESHGRQAERQALLSSLPRIARSGSVKPCKWQDLPKGDREGSHAVGRGGHL